MDPSCFSHRSLTALIFVYGCIDVAFLPYGEEWRLKRKIAVLELLSLKRVQSFQYIREEEVAYLDNKIREACQEKKNGTSVNMSRLIIATSNNIVTRCLLGQKFETADGKYSFGDSARKVMVHMTAFSFGNFFPSLRWMEVVTGLIPRINTTFREIDAFLDEVLVQHKSARRSEDEDPKSEKKDFIDILHQLQQDDRFDFEFTQADLKAMIMDMFVGGSDTTSTALEWAFAELIKNPRTMKKAQEEARRVVGNKSKVEEDDVRQMKYLECVVKETLRLHPPLALSPERDKIRWYVYLCVKIVRRHLKGYLEHESVLMRTCASSQRCLHINGVLLFPRAPLALETLPLSSRVRTVTQTQQNL
ncbi:hypothetical protein K1719_020152 [Acacia pycnantha]|nr:hypothetical protein K1719_020152 [Acacia pycnantha]